MSKIDRLGVIDNDTGEILSNGIEVVESVIKEEYNNKIRGLIYKLDNKPEDLTLEQWVSLSKIKRVNLDNLNSFTTYHQVNADLDLKLFDENISMKAYYYFRKLISKHCGGTYTLKFNGNGIANGRNIIKDQQIADTLDISLSTWRKVKPELIKFNLIKIITFEGHKYYKVNPCYVKKKKLLTLHTYYAFRVDIIKYELISRYQVMFWDKYIKEEYPSL